MRASGGLGLVILGLFARTLQNRDDAFLQVSARDRRSGGYDSTLIGALELSSKKWVFAVQLPGSKKHTRQVVEPSGSALVEMIERLKARSLAAGRPILRMIVCHERTDERKCGAV